MQQNTEVNLLQNNFSDRKSTLKSGLDHSPIEMLWNDLKMTVYSRHPKSIAELRQFCEEEWCKIYPECCAGLIHSYWRCLLEVFVCQRCFNQILKHCFAYFSLCIFIFVTFLKIRLHSMTNLCRKPGNHK